MPTFIRNSDCKIATVIIGDMEIDVVASVFERINRQLHCYIEFFKLGLFSLLDYNLKVYNNIDAHIDACI